MVVRLSPAPRQQAGPTDRGGVPPPEPAGSMTRWPTPAEAPAPAPAERAGEAGVGVVCSSSQRRHEAGEEGGILQRAHWESLTAQGGLSGRGEAAKRCHPPVPTYKEPKRHHRLEVRAERDVGCAATAPHGSSCSAPGGGCWQDPPLDSPECSQYQRAPGKRERGVGHQAKGGQLGGRPASQSGRCVVRPK